MPIDRKLGSKIGLRKDLAAFNLITSLAGPIRRLASSEIPPTIIVGETARAPRLLPTGVCKQVWWVSSCKTGRIKSMESIPSANALPQGAGEIDGVPD